MAAAWMPWLYKHVMPAWIHFRFDCGRKDLKKVKSRVMDEAKRARR
jgi:hypothetical protein